MAQKVNGALSENEGGGQSLGKADWRAGSSQGTREAGRHPRPLAFGHGKELQQEPTCKLLTVRHSLALR